MRKKEHKKVLRYMKKVNKQLATDEYLGLNRFRVDMYSETWHKYDNVLGGTLIIIFKLSDNVTGNTAYFISDNYDYDKEVPIHTNDFLIRCSSCHSGHYPPLHYAAYDIHDIVPYDGDKNKTIIDTIIDTENILNTYSWIKSVKF